MPADDGPMPERASYEALLAAVMRLVRTPALEQRLSEDKEAFLREGGLEGEDLAGLVAQSDKRLLVYRKLVHRGLARAIRTQLPRAAARLGEAFDAYVARFIDEEAPRSHYLRETIAEFVAWAQPRWAEDEAVPAYIGDLAQHELSLFEVAAAEADERGPASPELALDRPTRFDGSARLYRYTFAVHRLPEDPASRDEPTAEPTAFFAYRDAAHEVRYLELTQLAAAILERLLGKKTLRDAIVEGCAALAQPVDDAVLQSTAKLLTDLRERGALAGGEP